MRLAHLALVATLAVAPPALAQAPPTDPIQQQFIEAMQAMEAGRVADASALLAILAARTDAPRIRLELARALYFQGRLKEARAEFLKVYRMGALPYAVRRTINVFLSDIDQRAGSIEPRVALIYDRNPQLSAPSGTYDIFGIPLDYESTAEPSVGLRLEVTGAIPVPKLDVSLIGGASTVAYADEDLGQYALNGGVRKLDDGRMGWTGLGVTYFERRGQAPAITSFLERVRRISLPDQSKQLVARIALNHTSIRDADHLDGWGLEGAVDYGWDLSPNAAVNLTVSAGSAGAKYNIDRRVYSSLAGGVVLASPKWNKTVSLRASIGDSRYGGVDPFFNKRRDDVSLSAEARLVDGRPIWGLFPSVALTWDQRASSIDFFNYSQAGFALGLQRRF